MGKKLYKQRIKDQLDEAITIGQLIDHLKTLPADTYVGVVGHFGEAYLMDKYAFSYIRRSYSTATGSWRGKEHHIDVLALSVPDIGPAPD